MESDKMNRTLEIFFRGVRGEDLSPSQLAKRYGVSTKSVTRSIGEIKNFLAENRELVGHSELTYSHAAKAYRLNLDEFLSDKELFAITKILLASRAFSREDTLLIIDKLMGLTSYGDRKTLEEIIRKELYHYCEIRHDCMDVTENMWQLIHAIKGKKEITIRYFEMDRKFVQRRIQPVSLIFSEFYFYLIAYYPDMYEEPRYFRVDRITGIVQHREHFDAGQLPGFDEGELRKRSQFMFYGKLRRIRFWYTGPSVQAVLDRLPTAKIIERDRGNYMLEAEVYGDGIRMFLLSQGTWVKVISPEEFAREIRDEAAKIAKLYGN